VLACRAAPKLLDLDEPPTAIFASSDTMAIGALHAIHDRGLRVPEDIALIGYDDLSIAAHATPPLSSVRQPIAEMAAEAVRVLIERMKGTGPGTSVRLPAHLVTRTSSGEGVAGLLSPKGGTSPVLVSGAPTAPIMR